MDDWGTGTWIVMAVMMAAMLAVIVGVAWVFVRPFSRWAESRRPRDPALDELRARYARGEEVGDDELAKRKRELG